MDDEGGDGGGSFKVTATLNSITSLTLTLTSLVLKIVV